MSEPVSGFSTGPEGAWIGLLLVVPLSLGRSTGVNVV
jgi:hypothetical protein